MKRLIALLLLITGTVSADAMSQHEKDVITLCDLQHKLASIAVQTERNGHSVLTLLEAVEGDEVNSDIVRDAYYGLKTPRRIRRECIIEYDKESK